MDEHYVILFLGADWWGSDARALATSFRREGHYLIELQNEDFCPPHWSSLPLRILRRLFRKLMASNYNKVVLEHAHGAPISFVLVFKGNLLQSETIRRIKLKGINVYCVYPDVSYLDHDPEIWQCLPLYDCIFTTKSFHIEDPVLQSRANNLCLVSHGYDPQVHRPVVLRDRVRDMYKCDVSFVGCWSPRKEMHISHLLNSYPGLNLKIWGPGWARATALVGRHWQRRGAYGDELAIIHSASKINLGLLSEAGQGSMSGDQTTARSWQIPACGGFLLHEYSEEIAEIFDIKTEIATFNNFDELVDQTQTFLADEPERKRRINASMELLKSRDFTYSTMSKEIIEFHRLH